VHLKFLEAGHQGVDSDGAFQEAELAMEVEVDESGAVHTGNYNRNSKFLILNSELKAIKNQQFKINNSKFKIASHHSHSMVPGGLLVMCKFSIHTSGYLYDNEHPLLAIEWSFHSHSMVPGGLLVMS
jgi:hypothetical protein